MAEDEKPRQSRNRVSVRQIGDASSEEEVVRLPAGDFRKTKDVERMEANSLDGPYPGYGVDTAGEQGGRGGSDAEHRAILQPEESWVSEDRNRMPIPTGWVVLFSVLLLGVLVWALFGIPKGEADLERRTAEMEKRLKEDQGVVEDAERLNQQIDEVMRAYISATTVEEKLRHVRMPERVAPLMAEHYKTHPLIPLRSAGFYLFEPVAVDNYPFLLGKVELEGGGEKVLLLEDVGDRVLVDWESDVIHQPMRLDSYVRQRPLEPIVFRLNLAYDDFYAFEFADQRKYQSFFLSQLDDPEFLFGYVPRGGPVYRELVALLGDPPKGGGKGDQVASVMVRVRFPAGGAGPRSVVIEELVAPGWALVDPERQD